MKPSALIKLALAAALLGGAFWAANRLELVELLSPDRIQATLESAGPFAPLALIAMMMLAVVVSPLPSLPIDIAAGAFFGPWLGTLYAATGALFGSMIAFGLSRLLGREVVERFVGGHVNFCQDCSDHLLTRVVLFSRLVPVLSFDMISYGAGLTKMSLRNFAWATFVGTLPLTFVYTWSGPFLISGSTITVVFGIVMVAAFLLMPLAIERYDLFGMSKHFKHEE